MKFTNETLLEHYLEDLKLPDTTHGGRKAHNPQHWNFPSIAKKEMITIDLTDQTRDVWCWSDIHFNHKNIIKYSGRPFPNPDLMNKCLIGNYINVVKENDIVIWGGDITFGHIGEVNRILTQLPGYKIHIVGNHDMERDGKLSHLIFDERHPCYVINVVDVDREYQILVTHYPLDVVPEGCVNLHGHIHTHPAPTHRHINMCVEHTNYAPMNMRDVVKRASEVLKCYD